VTGRTLQWAHCCRTADDHPRHHHYDDNGVLMSKHIDCCAKDGCPDGSCPVALEESNNAQGQELIHHLERRALEAEANNA
jgi:hypothetical protein